MPQNRQNTISQTSIKHYNQSRNVIADTIRWLQIATDTGKIVKI